MSLFFEDMETDKFKNGSTWATSPVSMRIVVSFLMITAGPWRILPEERDTTTVVNNGYSGSIDNYGNIILTRGGNR